MTQNDVRAIQLHSTLNVCWGAMAAIYHFHGVPPGRRIISRPPLAPPYSRFLLHQLTAGVQGQAADIDIQAREILRIGQIMDEILVKHTGQPIEVIRRDSDRDFYMDAEEAKQYGLIDEVFKRDKKA